MGPGPALVYGLGGIFGISLMIGVFALDSYGNWLARRAARKNQHKNPD